ncbi:hypothetical protein [Hippea jasoniae]|uniref:hypothetical protein n=1 Tax=Hippea jasoniae TaxID=944479 RepID=UPI000555984F|nr:hypothetical protein [Hippea jasoniae]
MNEFVEQLKNEFKERLISVGLHNVGVTSFINKNGVFIVLDRVEPEDLLAIKRIYKKFKKTYSTPLVVNERFFKDAADVFCMEMLEFKENGEILYGKNVLEDIDVNDENLRRQIEFELRSKLLNLKGAFIDLPLERRIVDNIAYRSMYNFLLILRNLLRLKGKLINDATLIEVFEETFGVSLEAFKILRDSEKLPFERLLEVFKGYLREVEQLVEISDKILS